MPITVSMCHRSLLDRHRLLSSLGIVITTPVDLSSSGLPPLATSTVYLGHLLSTTSSSGNFYWLHLRLQALLATFADFNYAGNLNHLLQTATSNSHLC